jgi:peptide/nickel transport system permease protein
MRTYLLRRLLAVIPLLLAITFITQALLVIAPGSFLDTLRENPQISEAYIRQLERQYHLDTENVLVRYWYWAVNAVRGDFGFSYRYQQPVVSLIGERIFNTLLLSLGALFISWFAAIPLGILSAVKKDSWIDRVAGMLSFFGLSIPSLFFSLLLVLLAARTNWFPVGGIHDQVNWDYMTSWERITDTLWHLVLPATVLGWIGMAGYMRQMRGEMIETLSQDYIRTARAKGLGPGKVLYKHALGNAINPLITLFGFSFAYLLSGAFIVEFVFGWPGMGRLTLEALLVKDEPLVMASTVMVTLMLAAGNLLADILLALVDPRIRLE